MSEKVIPTREELKKLKVVTLRQRLSKLSLPQAGEQNTTCLIKHRRNTYTVISLCTDLFAMLFVGLKDDLITRLLEHYQQVSKTLVVCV